MRYMFCNDCAKFTSGDCGKHGAQTMIQYNNYSKNPSDFHGQSVYSADDNLTYVIVGARFEFDRNGRKILVLELAP